MGRRWLKSNSSHPPITLLIRFLFSVLRPNLAYIRHLWRCCSPARVCLGGRLHRFPAAISHRTNPAANPSMCIPTSCAHGHPLPSLLPAPPIAAPKSRCISPIRFPPTNCSHVAGQPLPLATRLLCCLCLPSFSVASASP
jgi:hypothetical protein